MNTDYTQTGEPTFVFEGVFANGQNPIYTIHIPDGNAFRYTWGIMVPFSTNTTKRPEE